MDIRKVIVIGAGVGGLMAATHLARRGFSVTVVEKNKAPGGRCDQFDHDGHTFDSGPTLLVMPQLYDAELHALGTSLGELLDLQRVDPTYRLFFDDGSQLDLTSDMQSMYTQLEAIEPGSFAGMLRYLAEGSRHYALSIPGLVRRDFRKASDFFSLRNLPLLYQVKPFANHYRNMGNYFKNPRLKAAFTYQDVYMGLSPFDAPATFSLMPYCEMAHGVYYPRGGMYSIVKALAALAQDAGVEFLYDTTVEQIEIQNRRARGVALEGGGRLAADVVVANADLPYVYQDLLPDARPAAALKRRRFSCSVISFFWGVDRVYPQLGPHTLFLADDYRDNFKSIIDELSLPQNPSLYLHAPVRLDPAMAPAGQDTLIAVVPVGHMRENDERDWGEVRDAAREHVFRRLQLLGITDLAAHLKFEACFTPHSWRKFYNLMKGSTHGLCHDLLQLAYFRPHNRHARYGNLYFTGASTHPGTGLPTVMVSGRLTAERVWQDWG